MTEPLRRRARRAATVGAVGALAILFAAGPCGAVWLPGLARLVVAEIRGAR